MKRTVLYAFRRSIPVMYGYLFLGITFGIMLRETGNGVLAALLSSLFIYAGSGQFLMCEFIADSTPLITCAVMTILLNSRHIFYGLSFLTRFNSLGKLKWVNILELTDETYSVLCLTEKEPVAPLTMFFISIFDHSYWIIGSIIGNLLGTIPFEFTGVDFSMTALFVVLFVEQWKTNSYKLPAITGFLSSLLFLFILGPDNFIFPSLVLSSVILIFTRSLYNKHTSEYETEGAK